MEMESNLLSAYQQAYELACSQLSTRDIDEIVLNTNAVRVPNEQLLLLKYLAQQYLINCTNGEITLAHQAEEVQNTITTTVKVLLLHYLLHAKVKPLSGRLISFREIPEGGRIYYQAFEKRAIKPLVQYFGDDIEGFFRAAKALDGIEESDGHASVTLHLFPLVPVRYVLWQGDDEFPASGTILFDDTITCFLPSEDIALAASFGVYGLIERRK